MKIQARVSGLGRAETKADNRRKAKDLQEQRDYPVSVKRNRLGDPVEMAGILFLDLVAEWQG